MLDYRKGDSKWKKMKNYISNHKMEIIGGPLLSFLVVFCQKNYDINLGKYLPDLPEQKYFQEDVVTNTTANEIINLEDVASDIWEKIESKYFSKNPQKKEDISSFVDRYDKYSSDNQYSRSKRNY